ncbi:MAG: hypothetical protein CSA07_02015 [Bacteroidia bacterium]|nr:MAG: hypothetical protein CSA07_02015 [Bacteroidia bacterium]
MLLHRWVSFFPCRLWPLALLLLVPGISLAGGAEEGELRVVVIDPGHGGKDPGTHGRVAKEKDVVLSVGLKLGKLIEENFPKVKVVYTRKTDVFIELNRRAEIANEAKADLFISIHANSAPSHVRGAETFVMGLHTTKSNFEVAQRENAVITYESDYTRKYEGYDPHSPESFIIFSLIQNVFLNQSLEFASAVQRQFTDVLLRHDRGVKQAGFLVLYKSSMPSVLIELGFLTHRQEEKFLVSKEGQDKMARAIFTAFSDYKKVRDARAAAHKAREKAKAEEAAPSKPEPSKPAAKDGRRIEFRVQVATIRHPLGKGHRLRREFPRLLEEKDGPSYRYYSHRTASFDEAQRMLQQVQKTCPDAFLVVFEDGVRRK